MILISFDHLFLSTLSLNIKQKFFQKRNELDISQGQDSELQKQRT
jgi:hypothetical protein